MTEWKWSGSRWWKFDFHTHTPASDDYGRGANQAALKNRTPKEWLLDFMGAGIDCIAITDHHTGAWIDQLKKALEELETERAYGFRKIYLFPGMEISANGGVHVLGIFDSLKSTADMDALRGAIEYGGTPGRSDAVTRKSFIEVMRTIETASGIAIPAHVDDENSGLFSQQGTTLQQALDCDCVFAMELFNPAFAKPQLYLDRKPNWTEVVGSDAHHPSGGIGQRFPGCHFTWIKMGEPCLEGLRLALLDGALSVRRSDQTTGDPNAHASSVIESIEVTEARYMGRSQPFLATFNPWLNAVIGGRGTGKSTLVEFSRMGLRRAGELPESLASDFEKYSRVYQSRDENGLLTSDSRFAVVYRKDATRYRVQWSERADVPPIEVETEPGVWTTEQGDVAQRFPVRIYSQKQIFELAKAPLALLRIVDEAPEVDRRGWQERWRELETRFLSLRAKAREIDAGLSEEGQLRGELEDIKRKLAVFEQAGHADILKNYQRRMRQQRLVETWEESWATGGDRIRGIARDLAPDSLDINTVNEEDEADRVVLDKASVAREGIIRVCEKIEALAQEVDRLVAEWRKEREESPWQEAVMSAIGAYEDLRQQLAKKGAGDPAAYGELVQRRQSIEKRLQAFEARRKEAESVRQQASTCLKQLVELRRELTKRRTDFLSKVLEGNPYVRVGVLPYGARETVEGEFRRYIQREGGGFERDIGGIAGQDGILCGLYGGAADSTGIEERLAELKTNVRTIAGGKCDPDMVRDQRFATNLAKLPPETFDRLDAWFPEDSLQVDYSTTADGSSFRSIQEGSPGQKTAALLAFLLSYGEEPIVLDQPEDDLDNHLIYDLIVTQLRNIKRRRQVIVVTHNANIVVNGDAELVISLAAKGGQTQKECAGSLQERNVRDTICAVMEGGREAFEQRYRRIALEARHV